jgi:Acyl-CoA reductase (LuxC)
MTVQQVVPAFESVSLDAALDRVVASPSLAPFADEVIGFCSDFSRAIFKDSEAAHYPELQALAFWMRKAELVRLRDAFLEERRAGVSLVPQGVAFHIPPANVDTIFVYSWLLSVLAGNRNIVRLSHRVSPQTEILCRLFNAALQSAPALSTSTLMLRYGHEREITEAISARADIRVIWGGDASVNSIRAIPLPPHARELTFPDRYSFAVLRASRYLEAADRRPIAEQFFNDTFWFDQMACSSPRLVFWEGPAERAASASADFLNLLQQHAIRKQYEATPATRMARFTFACAEAMKGGASSYQDFGQFAVLGLDRYDQLTREHCGGGLLFQYRIATLDDLLPFVSRRDQTLTYFGFERAELAAFAARLNGRGLDRLVPIGQALNFNRFWDGNDLLLSFLRYVYIA